MLLDGAARYRSDQATLLEVTTATAVGDTFDHGGVTYRRVVHKSLNGGSRRHRPIILAETTATGEQFDLAHLEDEAFWAWAVI